MSALRPDYWREESGGQLKYLAGALLLHALLGVLLIGFNWRSKPAVVPQLAINAVLVDRNTLNQLARAKPTPAPPVEDKQQQDDQRQKEKEQEQQKLQLQREQQEREKQEQLKQQQVERQQALDKQRVADEVEKNKQAELQRKAAQAEQQKQQQEAERKRLADIQQKQREVELKRQAEADAKAQASKEAELKAQLAAEEGRDSAVNSGLLNQYSALITQKIERSWIKPPTARSGLECEVKVTQAVGGVVLSVEVGRCNGDDAVRNSIEAAVQRASPLPAPPDPRLFQRVLLITFKPTE